MTVLARVDSFTPQIGVIEPHYNQWVELVAPAAELARQIAETDFVPKEMRNKPAAITACILYGAEIGIGPMQSLAKVDIINGRPAPRAELGRALALGAGHEIWVDESTNTRVKVSGRRRDSERVQSVTWTLDDVKKAGISNQNYGKYPRQMLLARASAELVRMMCPDVLGGVTMFAEEAGDIDTEPVAATETVKATTRKRATPVTPEAPALPDDTPEPSDGPTAKQMSKMMACFNDLGIIERDERLTFTSTVIDRDVASAKELSKDEAGRVIDVLERRITETGPPLPDDE